MKPMYRMTNEQAYPISGKDNKFILGTQLAVEDLRDRNKTTIFEAEVSKSPGHGKSGAIFIRQPESEHCRFLGE